MITRPLFIGLIALATLPSARSLNQAIPTRILLNAPLGGIGVLVFEQSEVIGSQPAILVVQLDGEGAIDGQKLQKPLDGMALQVWLLRADGTAIARRGKGQPASVNVSMAGGYNDSVAFTFEDGPPKELAGVVVSINGNLFVREIKSS